MLFYMQNYIFIKIIVFNIIKLDIVLHNIILKGLVAMRKFKIPMHPISRRSDRRCGKLYPRHGLHLFGLRGGGGAGRAGKPPRGRGGAGANKITGTAGAPVILFLFYLFAFCLILIVSPAGGHLYVAVFIHIIDNAVFIVYSAAPAVPML